MSIGNRIKSARKEKNWTQKKLGEECGIHEVQIRGYENGNRIPKIETLEKIASALNVSPAWLKYGDSVQINSRMIEFYTKETDLNKLIEEAERTGEIPDIDPKDKNIRKIVNDIIKENREYEDNQRILLHYTQLNEKGKQKAIEYASDLTQMEKYTQKED